MNSLGRYIICEISDKTFDTTYIPGSIRDYHVRVAARGILMHDGKVALIHVTQKGHHKLPGGGVENNETYEKGFIREVREETGCTCVIKDAHAITIEYRDKQKLVQLSYIYFADVTGEIHEPQFEQSEIEEGHQLVWVPFDEVEHVFTKDNPDDWESNFIHYRDQEIFSYYKKQLKR